MSDNIYDTLHVMTWFAGMYGVIISLMWAFDRVSSKMLRKASNIMLVTALTGTLMFACRPDRGRYLIPILDILLAFGWAKYAEQEGA